MFIQCSIDFHLWTVEKYKGLDLFDWFCNHIGKSWHFLKSHILNKSFRQNSDQSSVVTWIQQIYKFLLHQKDIQLWVVPHPWFCYDSFGLWLSFLGGRGLADVHGLVKYSLHIKTKIDYHKFHYSSLWWWRW